MKALLDGKENALHALWEDGERVFCRRWRGGNDSRRIAALEVVPAAEPPTRASLDRLAHEYGLKDELDSAWALRPLELVRERGRTVLVLEDPGATPLAKLLGQPMAVERFVRLAIGVAAALARVHQRGLIHKDIKPANVLVNCITGQIWLTGFGIASRLPREHQAPHPPEFIDGTLAYMAPEQTGRMNRTVDSRSDLYALGVTLYEMATGHLPFTAADPMEWVHCHIARLAVPPDAEVASFPAPLSAIVMKLLAKTPEERYQTALGVAADLRKCLASLEASGRIDPFPLGAEDASDRLVVPEKLYGREREIDSLLQAFDRVVADGTPNLVLVSGYSGIGKSSVVNELHKVLVPPRGLFASGKFDQYKRDIPYATLTQAFQSLVRPLLGQSEAELGRWQEALREALGPNVQLMVNLVPDLEAVIGAQQPVRDLPPQDAKSRFQMVFRRFLGVFARQEHPLALFLDDLQWLDSATLDLLEHLVTHADVRHLLLVGAYRDNEVGPAHPLLRTLAAIREAGARVEEIALPPLRLDDIARLVADGMRCQKEHAWPLARLVHKKTGGNPFFAIQFFTALAEEGLLAFDPIAAAWTWDIDRIRAKNYTDNVVDLIAGRLKRFSAATQEAVKQLACLGSVAKLESLTLVQGATLEAVHAALREAVHAGLVIHLDGAYKFLHDRIQQAAYSLIPEEQRAEFHLRLGRVLLAGTTADELTEHLFEVANQLNRGAALLVDRDEKAHVATINLRAGRKAKASAAYASACLYLGAGMALLGESDWGSQYKLMFSLWLERAACEFLNSNFHLAEQLIGELLERGASKVDLADAYHLKVQLHEVKAEYPQAVASALPCLRLLGIDIAAHPTWEQVQAEYETVWRNLDGRPIETIIDLPLMTDPELLAAMRLLSILLNAAYYSDFHLFCLYLCRLVNISIRHGTSGPSTHAYGWLGNILGTVFHRYREGYSLGKLSCDLVERHGFIAYQARVHLTMNMVAIWTRPIATALDSNRAAFRTATATGDLTYACYSLMHTVADLLVRNDPLDAVWRESETALDFVRKARYRDIADTIVSQQRFIATMQGRTAAFSTFSDAEFDETAFEAQLTDDRMTTMVCYYWIIKLKARFLSGDYAEALAAAGRAKALLWAATGQIYLLDYFYYTALTMAALYQNASTDQQIEWHALLTAHREQLREWAENFPPTFADKHALVSAEIARIERQDADAMRLYEQAIEAAREHRFVQNEGAAHELAARFYLACGSTTAGRAHLQEAHRCFGHWGADGKVRQLEQSHPQLREEPRLGPSTAVFDIAVASLDTATVIKASQAVSGEILADRLIQTLMMIALEHAGAERGLLLLQHGDEYRIEAVATTGRETVTVSVRQASATSDELPQSVLRYVIRTQDAVIIDDASAANPFSTDEYIITWNVRSVLCLPLLKQAKLIGALYLENNLTPYAFTPNRIAVLRIIVSQATISLENARLYTNLREAEAYLAEAQRISHTGSFGWSVRDEEIYWSDETYEIFGVDRKTHPTLDLVFQRTHPEDVDALRLVLDRARRDGTDWSMERRLLMPDGFVKTIRVVARATRESGDVRFVGAIMDITQSKQAEAALHKAQAELLQAARLTTMGELAATIAHEVKQPLSAMIMRAETGLRSLHRAGADIDQAKRAFERIAADGHRAGEIIESIRANFKKGAQSRTAIDVNELIGEALAFARGSLQQHRITVRAERNVELPQIEGDRIQLQQVLLNLITNAIESMASTAENRVLRVSSELRQDGDISVSVEDTGGGVSPQDIERIFNPLFTTKPDGMGMGLSICRSIVESHGGRLWASPRQPHGSVFRFTLPSAPANGFSIGLTA